MATISTNTDKVKKFFEWIDYIHSKGYLLPQQVLFIKKHPEFI